FQQHHAHRDGGESGNDVEQRGFSAAGMSDDRYVFALVDRQVDILQHLGGSIAAGEDLVDVVELQIGSHVMFLQFSAVPRVTICANPAMMRSSTKPMIP